MAAVCRASAGCSITSGDFRLRSRTKGYFPPNSTSRRRDWRLNRGNAIFPQKQSLKARDMAKNEFEVVIIGGGAAGVAAGRRLHDAGLDVLILEARDRLCRRGLARVDEIRHPLRAR